MLKEGRTCGRWRRRDKKEQVTVMVTKEKGIILTDREGYAGVLV